MTPLDRAEVDRVLARLGLADHDPLRWEVLNWFVQFARRDLDAASEGDWQSLTEEVQALLHLITYQQLQAPLSHDDLAALQEYVMKVLMGLVDTTETPIMKLEVKFQISAFIRRGKGRTADASQVKRLGPVTGFPAGPFAGFIGPDGPQGLIYHLACLLIRFPDVVQRCPKCHRLFARFRRHAEYCSRECQSQVAAHDYRLKKKAESEDRKKKRMKPMKKGAAR